MSDDTAAGPGAAAAPTAGSLLRQARQAQGLHIAALAATIKVQQRKLEALEADRFEELPDATFTRALAQTVCRTLKIDAAPVLALLPRPPGHRLEHVGEGINAPFRDRPGTVPAGDWGPLASPALWAPLLLVIAAAVVYFLPAGWLSLPRWDTDVAAPARVASAVTIESVAASAPLPTAAPSEPASAPAVAETSAPAQPAASVVVETVHSLPAATEAASAAALPASGVLQLRALAESWVEVTDGRGQTLLSRIVQPGESVGLDGSMPMKLTIGNAAATQVSFRGKALDLAPHTRRDNVARIELK
jgi:cytoskeleton protein RodZ